MADFCTLLLAFLKNISAPWKLFLLSNSPLTLPHFDSGAATEDMAKMLTSLFFVFPDDLKDYFTKQNETLL